ncbi:MAG: response regulator [Desulfobacteraceae bacterium]|nr:response regulator [Desulfobacteraceae bacterium]
MLRFSAEPGKGSLFRFGIQAEIADTGSVNIRQPARRIIAVQSGQTVWRILIADDKSDNRRLLIKLLEPLGFDLREAENGQEAVAISESWEPHLIWMDMRMPVMDGYEATRRIRNTAKGQATAIIAFTASAFEEERSVVLSAGCNDFLRKPFREAELFDIMSRHLGIRYIYDEDEALPDSGQTKKDHRNALTPEAFSALSPEIVKDLENAAIRGDINRIAELIRQISDDNAALADALTDLSDEFEYTEILRLIQT